MTIQPSSNAETVITKQVDALIEQLLRLKQTNEPLRIAILGVDNGVSSLACAGLLDGQDELHLFDFEDRTREIAKRLRNHPCCIKAHGHSHKLYDNAAWQLAAMLQEGTGYEASFNLIYMDGAAQFWQDGLALSLLRKLIKPGGVIMFPHPDRKLSDMPEFSPGRFPQLMDVMTVEQVAVPQLRLAIIHLLDSDPAFSVNENVSGCLAYSYCPRQDAPETSKNSALQEYFLSSSIKMLPLDARRELAAQHLEAKDTLSKVLEAISKAGIYDTDKYLEDYPDVKLAGIDPILHFARFGILEGRSLREKQNTPVLPPKPLKPRIIRSGALESFYTMPLHVNWGITDMCNYKCSYCFGQKPLDKSRFTSFQNLKLAVDHIAELKRDQVNFTFGGGEPTTHPDLGQLILYIHKLFKKKLQHITVISNGSRNIELYELLASNNEIDRLNFIISLHTEFINIDHISALVKLLSNKFFISFSLMFHPEKKEFVKEINSELCSLRREYPFNMGVTLLRGGPRFDRIDERYTPADFELQRSMLAKFDEARSKGPEVAYLSQRGYAGGIFWNYDDAQRPFKKMMSLNRSQYLKEGDYNFKNMYCVQGSSIVCIDPFGMAYGAQSCSDVKIRYNIFNENPYKRDNFITPVRCTAANCGCAANDSIPKFVSKEEAMEFARMFKYRQAELLTGNYSL